MNYEEIRYTKQIRITPEDLEWIKTKKGKKSAAAFLEDLINQVREGKEHL